MNGQDKEYIVYECMTCHKTTILLRSETEESKHHGKYQTCGHDGRHSNLREMGSFTRLNECMSARTYVRAKSGSIKETR